MGRRAGATWRALLLCAASGCYRADTTLVLAPEGGGRALKIRYLSVTAVPKNSSKWGFSSAEKSDSSCPNELSKKIPICSSGYRFELTAYITLLWELISKT